MAIESPARGRNRQQTTPTVGEAVGVARVRWQHLAPSVRPGRYYGLVAATGVSSIGDGIVGVTLPLLAAAFTRNALAVSGLLMAIRLPWLGALPLGAVADRSDRRRMALGATVAQGVLFLLTALAVAVGIRSLVMLYVVALATGILEVAFAAATAAVVPDLVPRDKLASANGRLEAIRLSGDLLTGQAVGAVLFVALASLPFLLDGVSFLAAAAILFFVLPLHAHRARTGLARTGAAPSAAPTTLREDVVAGAHYLWRHTGLRLMAATICGLAFFQAMVMGILVVFALGPLHVGRSSYGLFLAVAAIGWASGGFLAGRIDRRLGHARSLVLGAAAASAAYLVLAPAPSAVVAAGALFVEGFAVSLGNVASLSIRQERVPRELLGRINSAFRMVTYGAVPLGALAGGLVSEVWSLRGAVLTAGVLQTIVLLWVGRPLLAALAEEDIDLRDDELVDVRVG
ncbi:MAG TPA: MFS transporter [Acidimicrobiales bacterium]